MANSTKLIVLQPVPSTATLTVSLGSSLSRELTSSFYAKSEYFQKPIKDFLSSLSLGFKDFRLENDKVLTVHKKYDDLGSVVTDKEFDMRTQESSGTNKLYDMAGYIIATIGVGGVIIIDELDAKLHPVLTMAIVKMFNSSKHNSRKAQLIFATHDTNLLCCGGFRRDQIYFTEKNQSEETDLYSLVEYIEPNGKKIRKDRSFEKDYINGRYGAIPYVGDFSRIIEYGESSES